MRSDPNRTRYCFGCHGTHKFERNAGEADTLRCSNCNRPVQCSGVKKSQSGQSRLDFQALLRPQMRRAFA